MAPTTGELVPASKRLQTVQDMLRGKKLLLAQALPRHMTPERFLTLAFSSVQRTPKLLEANAVSLVGAILKAGQLGLEIDDVMGHAHLVPFWNGREKRLDVVLIPGYKGLMDLARRSRQVAWIDAQAVYKTDTFSYAFGDKPFLRHVPKLEKHRVDEKGNPLAEDILAFYAIAKLRDGSCQFKILSREDVEAVRDRFSRAFQQDPLSAWATHFPEMGCKTLVRRLVKYLPASPELLEAVGLEDRAEAGDPVVFDAAQMEDVFQVAQPDDGHKPSKLDTLTDQLQKQQKQDNGTPSDSGRVAAGMTDPTPADPGVAAPGTPTPAGSAPTDSLPVTSAPLGPVAPMLVAPIHQGAPGMVQCLIRTCRKYVHDLEAHYEAAHKRGPKRRSTAPVEAPLEGTIQSETQVPDLNGEYQQALATIKAATATAEVEAIRTRSLARGGLFERLDLERRKLLASALMGRMMEVHG